MEGYVNRQVCDRPDFSNYSNIHLPVAALPGCAGRRATPLHHMKPALIFILETDGFSFDNSVVIVSIFLAT